jgi:hypothetical protein
MGAAELWQLAQAPSNSAAPGSVLAVELAAGGQGGDVASDEVF